MDDVRPAAGVSLDNIVELNKRMVFANNYLQAKM